MKIHPVTSVFLKSKYFFFFAMKHGSNYLPFETDWIANVANVGIRTLLDPLPFALPVHWGGGVCVCGPNGPNNNFSPSFLFYLGTIRV